MQLPGEVPGAVGTCGGQYLANFTEFTGHGAHGITLIWRDIGSCARQCEAVPVWRGIREEKMYDYTIQLFPAYLERVISHHTAWVT
jgi:hypothetical protein